MRRIVALLIFAFFIASLTASIAAEYQIYDLGVLPGGSSGWAFGINDAGQIVGWATGSGGASHRAVIWDVTLAGTFNAVITDVGSGDCRAINNPAQIAGYDSDNRAYLYNVTGIRIDLISPQGSAATYRAFGMNDSGNIVGHSQTSGSGARGVLWTVQGGTVTSRTTLKPMSGTTNNAYARAINETGIIAGYANDSTNNPHAVCWDASANYPRQLSSSKSHAYAINDSTVVAGDVYVGSSYRAAFWSSTGTQTYLNNLPGKTGSYYAYGINNVGQIVGCCSNRAILWEVDGTPVDLGTLTGSGTSEAHGINEDGWIVGYSTNASGIQRAVVWIPQTLPPPSPIGSIKSLPDGTTVSIEDAVVTAAALEAGVSFVESPDRSCGIKVLTGDALTVGQKVTFRGTVRRIDGEWQIGNVSFSNKTGGNPLSPVFMSSRTIGNDPTEQLVYAGINTTGLLVRIYGTATGTIPAENVIYVDDGGSYQDGLPNSHAGIRVKLPAGVTLPSPGQHVSIAGISRVQKATLTNGGTVNGMEYPPDAVVYAPSIWVRDAGDITVY